MYNQNNIINNKKYYKNSNYLLDEDKKREREEEKKKKIIYQLMLDEQIKEKKLRELKEKEKQIKEDLFYEEKYKKEQEEQFKVYQNQNFNNNNNYNRNNYNNDRNNFQKNEKEYESYNININQNNNQSYNNIYSQRSINNQFAPKDDNVISSSTQIPSLNINNLNNIKDQGYKTENNYYPNNRINITQQQMPNYFISQNINPYMTQNQHFNIQQNKPTLTEIPTNMSVSPSVIFINCQMPTNMNKMMNSNTNITNSMQSNQFGNNMALRNLNVNELNNMNNNMYMNNHNYMEKIMEKFFYEQNKIIESYKETIKKLKNERDEALIRNKANEEKLLALENIQKMKNKFQQKIDYIPFKDEYNQEIDNFLNPIQKEELNTNNQKGEISIFSDSKLPPLITSTKLVKPNSQKDIIETWKKEKKENGKKLEFNGMDTNYIMNKISQIKNTILENSNENSSEKKNDCMIDISLISKTNEEKLNNKNNNELQSESEFLIETNEHANINNVKKEEFNDGDSMEIISNKNNELKEGLVTDNEINFENDKNNIIENENKEKSMQKNSFDIHLFNLDNNVSSSTQIRKRDEYKKQNINFNKFVLNKKLNDFNNNSNNNKNNTSKRTIKSNCKENNISKKEHYTIIENSNNEIIGVNGISNYNEISDTPNIYSIQEPFHTIQTFNPNKNKKFISIKKSANNYKEKEILNNDIIEKINYFDDNSLSKDIKTKNNNNKNMKLKPNDNKSNKISENNDLMNSLNIMPKEYKIDNIILIKRILLI